MSGGQEELFRPARFHVCYAYEDLHNLSLRAPHLLHVWSIGGLRAWQVCTSGTWDRQLLSLPSQTSDSRSDFF